MGLLSDGQTAEQESSRGRDERTAHSYDDISAATNATDWIWNGLEHGAILSVLETANERTLTELNYYRDKQALEELGPDQILRKLEDEEREG
jgi:hypothetical protein